MSLRTWEPGLIRMNENEAAKLCRYLESAHGCRWVRQGRRRGLYRDGEQIGRYENGDFFLDNFALRQCSLLDAMLAVS